MQGNTRLNSSQKQNKWTSIPCSCYQGTAKATTPSVDPLLLTLLTTVVKLSKITIPEGFKTNFQKKILQLYNCSWLHHELCVYFISTPKIQKATHFFGHFLHDLSGTYTTSICGGMLKVNKC